MSSDQLLKSINPATGEIVGEVPVATPEQIDDAVRIAHQAQPAWAALAIEERGNLLIKAGQVLAEQSKELGDLLSREMGKPLNRGVGEVRICGKEMAGKVRQIISALQPQIESVGEVETTISYEAIGVVGVVSPWNYPMRMPHGRSVDALMAGNTVVVKPSEETPLIAQAYVDILNQFLPEGVLQIVHGGREQGQALVDADVQLVAFTGSRATGIDIMRRCSASLKRIVLELGGKDPLIVLADADIEKAAQFAVSNSFGNAGQTCVSTERVFVHSDVAEEFEALVTKLTAKFIVGPWNEDGVVVGPMIHGRQRQLVIDQINQAITSGAKVLAGGKDHPEGYVNPTVLTDVRHDMNIATDETFGPVVSITRFDDLDEAIRQANDTPYGLGAVVFGENKVAANQVADQLDAGMMGVNMGIFGVGDTPWVGAKQSGFGYHGSPGGYRQCTQVRVTSRNIG